MNRRFFVVLAPFLFTACEKAEIETYRVAKTKVPQVAAVTAKPAPSGPAVTPVAATAAPGGMANTAVPTASGANLTWTAPSHWKAQQASAMRKGTYLIAGEGTSEAELSITAFPGDVGGELANVNRWRGQANLAPITAADLPKAVTRIEKNGLKIAVIDIVGEGSGAKRTLGAMVPFNGATWFFKLTGQDALVGREKAAFMTFIESVKPAQ
jgi:hypothetical protein